MIIQGDSLQILRLLDDQTANCCVTSPPYWGLRDYGVEGQIGLEKTPEEYVEKLVEVFREVRRVLKDDGTLWLNLGDSYAGYWGDKTAKKEGRRSAADTNGWTNDFNMNARPSFHTAFDGNGIKPKDLVGIPWMLAFALRADGWYLRSDIIWSKSNPMPESVKDRPTKSHEYIFLLSKSPKYYYDHEAIKEPISQGSIKRLSQENRENQAGSTRANGGTRADRPMKPVFSRSSGNLERKYGDQRGRPHDSGSHIGGSIPWEGSMRNKRTVWNVSTKPFKGAHFATFPPDLIEPCILAGCPVGGTVIDPFSGASTTGLVAEKHGREYIGIELNPDYVKLAENRLKGEKSDAHR